MDLEGLKEARNPSHYMTMNLVTYIVWAETCRKLQSAVHAGLFRDTRKTYRLLAKKPVLKCPIRVGTKEDAENSNIAIAAITVIMRSL